MTDPTPETLAERVFTLARLLTLDADDADSAPQNPHTPPSCYSPDVSDNDEEPHGRPQT